MREITLEEYKRADRDLEREEARRGLTIHAIVSALVMTGLIVLNLTVATEFPWAVFPLIGWGIGLTSTSCGPHRGAGRWLTFGPWRPRPVIMDAGSAAVYSRARRHSRISWQASSTEQ